MNNIWTILIVVALVILVIYWRNRNAVWGGLTAGAVIGLLIALFSEFDWPIVLKGAVIGTGLGFFAEMLGGAMKNTKEKGTIQFLVYKSGKSYVGVCLTFDIVEEGSNPKELTQSIIEAAKLHLETVIKHDLSDDLLNRPAPKEYWDKFYATLREIESQKNKYTGGSSIISPYTRELVITVA